MGEITDLGYKLSFSGDQTDQMLDLVNDRTPTPASGSDLPFTAGGAYNLGLAADVNYYVAPNGSDSNDGLSASTPFATIQKAIDMIPSNLNGRTATIHLANGTYSEYFSIYKKLNGLISISGTGATIGGGTVEQCDKLRLFVGKISALTSNISLLNLQHVLQAQIYAAEISDDSGEKSKNGIVAYSDANVQIFHGSSYSYPVAFKGLNRCVASQRGSTVFSEQVLAGSENNNTFFFAGGGFCLVTTVPSAGMASTLYQGSGGRVYAGAQANAPSY